MRRAAATNRKIRTMTTSRTQYMATFLPSLAILGGAVGLNRALHVPMRVITSDSTTVARTHPLVGVLSNLGILLWCSTAAVCFFVAWSARGRVPERVSRFLVCSGCLTGYILLDDFFLFHEALAPIYLGIKQEVVIGALGVAALVYLVSFRQVILRTNYGMLLFALGWLGASVVIDQFFAGHHPGDRIFFLEDGSKWLGIACWFSYFMGACHQMLVNRPDRP